MSPGVLEHHRGLVERARSSLAAGGGTTPIRIQVGSATCEHAAGALEVASELRKHIAASGRTDIELHRVGCTGRCSREPIVGVLHPGRMPIKYERVDRESVHRIFTQHVLAGEPVVEQILDGGGAPPARLELVLCSGTRCGAGKTALFKRRLAELGAQEQVRVLTASCFGSCGSAEEGRYGHALVRPGAAMYRFDTQEEIDRIIRARVHGEGEAAELQVQERLVGQDYFALYADVPFFSRQTRVAMRNHGVIDPESIAEYLLYDGFKALAAVLARGDPEWVIGRVGDARLRGRGGGGYSTGLKWQQARAEPGDERFFICNADEGDPGAFMDRSMLESDPFNIIEGLIIGGYAIGAGKGFFYVRAEYPLAIRRLENAIRQCREWGVLGAAVLGSPFAFDLEIRLGAGAFVCGEETALIHSIEGERGQPRPRPPFPTEHGLWGAPTCINNVETLANVAPIINYGSEWFSRLGTAASGGTKVFALAGKVRHTGLVEVPMGTSLREIVDEIGGGVAGERGLKAVQTGGPAGGCIPARLLDTPVDYDTLHKLGSIMGSGGMIVLDDTDCMVDIAKFFMAFSQDESCGKCTPCREGTTRMMEVLERLTGGQARPEDLERLLRLGMLVKRASLCGLGRAAPNPVLSTLAYFREEYEAHVADLRCPAKRCVALIHYEIDAATCVGCTVCARKCPVACIAGERKQLHVIDQARCIRCGQCFDVCRFDAVLRS